MMMENEPNQKFSLDTIRYVNTEKMFLLLCILVWVNNTVIFFVRLSLQFLPFIGEYSGYFVNAIYVIVALGAVSYIFRYVKLADIAYYLILVVVYFYGMFFGYFDNAKIYLSGSWFTILVQCALLYFVGLGFRNIHQLNYFRIASRVAVITSLLLFFLIRGRTEIFQQSAMGFSYALLTHALFLISSFFEYRDKIDLFFGCFGFVIILAYGSRGPLLCGIIFIVVYLVCFKKYRNPFVVRMLIVLTGGTVYFFLSKILTLLQEVLIALGGSTRSIELFLSGDYFFGNGREVIFEQALQYISQRMFSGYGIASDRYLTSQYNTVFPYIHNIVLELWLAFGVIIGSVIFIQIVIIIFRGIHCAQSIEFRNMILSMALGIAFLRLFVSGSYLITPMFFFMIGLCVGMIREERFHRH